MRLGAETNTRWLWFITYIFLPFNVIGEIFLLFWFLNADQGGLAIISILGELGLIIATIIGLHQFKTWGWYCIMVIFGIQLIGTPLKVYAKASMNYEIVQVGNRLFQSQGREPIAIHEPSFFDFQPMLAFFMLLAIWTIPNAVYMYRRRSLFALSTSSSYGMSRGLETSSTIGISVPMNNVVTSMEEQAFANAQREYDSGSIREGLMVKVSTEEPDPQKQRLLYIRYRAQQLCIEGQQLCIERQRHDIIERNEVRKATVKFWAIQVTKQLLIAVLLFFIPIFSSFPWLGFGIIGYMLSGLVFWTIYYLLLRWGKCSRIWLAIPVFCFVCHTLSYYASHEISFILTLSGFLAIPYFIVVLVRTARLKRAGSR